MGHPSYAVGEGAGAVRAVAWLRAQGPYAAVAVVREACAV